jgi:hypothetical protein
VRVKMDEVDRGKLDENLSLELLLKLPKLTTTG